MYNVVVVSDENYIKHIAVMLSSLFEYLDAVNTSIFVLTDRKCYDRVCSLSPEGHKLDMFCRQRGASVSFIPCSLDKADGLPTAHWSKSIYLKLFMPSVLPRSVGRCIFLDADIIINKPIDKLYNIELGDNVIAACEDIPVGVSQRSRLGMPDDSIYINSGVMVCDMSKWRLMENNLPIFDYAKSIADCIQNEQEVISKYFTYKILCLPIKYNMVTFYFRNKPEIDEKYLPELCDAKRNPVIIHYATRVKPWYKDCDHPLGYLYLHYKEKTPWKSDKLYYFYNDRKLHSRVKEFIRIRLNWYGILCQDGEMHIE